MKTLMLHVATGMVTLFLSICYFTFMQSDDYFDTELECVYMPNQGVNYGIEMRQEKYRA